MFRVDRFGLPTFVAPPSGTAATAITRDSVGQPTLIRTFSGARVEQQWNADGNLVRSIQRMPGPWRNRNAVRYDTTEYTYDPTWKTITKITPPIEQDEVEFTYDTYGRRETVTDGRGNVTTFHYTTDGLLARIQEPQASGLINGEVDTISTVYSYHPNSRNLTSITKGSRSTTYTYDPTHHSDVLSVEDASSGEVEYTYDGIKRVLSVTSSGPLASASEVTYVYDDTLRKKIMMTPDERETTWQYDVLGRVTSECRPNGCITTAYADGVNATAVTKPGSALTTFTYNASGHLTKRQSQADTVLFGYDLEGGLVSVKSGRSRIQRQYDIYGRMTCERHQIRYVEDTLFKGIVAWHDFDAMGRRRVTYYGDDDDLPKPCEGSYIEEQFPDPNDPPDMYDPSTWYDLPPMPAAASNWVMAGDSIGYTYDAAGNLATIKNAIWSKWTGGTNTWTYGYDAKNRITSLAVPVSGYTRTWQYNATGDLAKYVVPNYWQAELEYDQLGRVEEAEESTGTKDYTYDGLGRLKSETTPASHTYTYDLMGNRKQDAGYSYHYGGETGQPNNNFGRLLLREELPGGTGSGDTHYKYDVRGNLIRSGSIDVVTDGMNFTRFSGHLQRSDRDSGQEVWSEEEGTEGV